MLGIDSNQIFCFVLGVANFKFRIKAISEDFLKT